MISLFFVHPYKAAHLLKSFCRACKADEACGRRCAFLACRMSSYKKADKLPVFLVTVKTAFLMSFKGSSSRSPPSQPTHSQSDNDILVRKESVFCQRMDKLVVIMSS